MAHLSVKQDIVYAKPSVKPLKYGVLILDSGGWVTHDEKFMRSPVRDLVRAGQGSVGLLARHH